MIVGGESGPRARPFDLAWAQSIVDQCAAADVACFVKQLGANPVEHDGYPRRPYPVKTRDRAGADPAEWPAELRVREWPVTQ